MSKIVPKMPGSPGFQFMHQLLTGQKQGLGVLYYKIQAQAWLLAYNDAYRLLAIMALLCAPWCFLLRRVGGVKAGAVIE